MGKAPISIHTSHKLRGNENTHKETSQKQEFNRMSQKLGRQQDALSAVATQHSEKPLFFHVFLESDFSNYLQKPR